MSSTKTEMLIHPIMLQAHIDSVEMLSPVLVGDVDLGIDSTKDEKLRDETTQVANLRKTNTTNYIRVLDIDTQGNVDSSKIESPRDITWDLSVQLKKAFGRSAAYYFLNDQNQYGKIDTSRLLRALTAQGDSPFYVRTEEGLLPVAEQIIDNTLSEATRDSYDKKVKLCDDHKDCINKQNENGGMGHIPLRGYTFSPKDSSLDKRIHFDHFPSCAVFIAAVAIEQMLVADHTIRVFNRSIKDREYAARTLVSVSGYTDAPIDSVATSDTGGINKIFSWYKDPLLKQSIRDKIKTA